MPRVSPIAVVLLIIGSLPAGSAVPRYPSAAQLMQFIGPAAEQLVVIDNTSYHVRLEKIESRSPGEYAVILRLEP